MSSVLGFFRRGTKAHRQIQQIYESRLTAAERERDAAIAANARDREGLARGIDQVGELLDRLAETERERDAAEARHRECERACGIVIDGWQKRATAAEARVREVEARYESEREAADRWHQRMLDHKSRIAALEEALRPFAKETDAWTPVLPEEMHPIIGITYDEEGGDLSPAKFTLGDLRRARALLAPAAGEKVTSFPWMEEQRTRALSPTPAPEKVKDPALGVECPVCHAAPGDPCTAGRFVGGSRGWPHAVRIARAQATPTPAPERGEDLTLPPNCPGCTHCGTSDDCRLPPRGEEVGRER